MKMKTPQYRRGRDAEIHSKLDEAINSLKREIAQRRDRGEPPPEDIATALERARTVRDLLEMRRETPSIRALILFAIRVTREVVETVNNQIDCFFHRRFWRCKPVASSV